VLDRLASVLADIGDNSVAVFKSAHLGDLGNCLEYSFYATGGFIRDSVGRFNMTFGNDQNVYGSLGIDILEGVDLVVFIDLLGGDLSRDYFTE
jgi:hypothetical protein